MECDGVIHNNIVSRNSPERQSPRRAPKTGPATLPSRVFRSHSEGCSRRQPAVARTPTLADRYSREVPNSSPSQGARKRAGIVVNPTKVDDQDKLRRECTKAAKEAGWDEPLWLETTLEDPGVGQAHQAVSAGCDIVFAAGGDGTVRLVGSALTGTDIPLGLMPQGTGNLLARNLGVSVDGSAAQNFARSLVGHDTRIDVGRVHATFDDGSAKNDTFLIMAGFGLDGDIMDSTSEGLKKRVGWMAYPLAGIKYFTERPERMLASFDDGAPRTKKTTTLLVGNFGRLTGGVKLMPDATGNDGWFDAVWLSADGPLQWGALTRQILTKSRRNTNRVERVRARRVEARAMGRERAVELDGDVIGQARDVSMWIDSDALVVRIADPKDSKLSDLRSRLPGPFGQDFKGLPAKAKKSSK